MQIQVDFLFINTQVIVQKEVNTTVQLSLGVCLEMSPPLSSNTLTLKLSVTNLNLQRESSSS